jgi:hypothetical protein
MTGRHREFLPNVLGVFALVAGYGVINDQFIVGIAPNYFAVYYPHYFPFESARLQALYFGLIGAGAPGLGWGILLYWAGHYGKLPQIGTRATLLLAGTVLIITGLAAWGLGRQVAATNHTPYPNFFYPDPDGFLNVTQTVQLTNYLVGVTGAALSIMGLWASRILRTPPEETVT